MGLTRSLAALALPRTYFRDAGMMVAWTPASTVLTAAASGGRETR